jgi:hypothetical protein
MGFVVLGLGVQTFFSKKKKFPETHIGHNREMRKRKIYCAQTEQRIIDKELGYKSGSSCSDCGYS